MRRENSTSRLTSGIITLQDIADQCGVSKAAARWAVMSDDDTHVSKQTRERVRKVAQELGYNPAANQAARRLAYRKAGKAPLSYLIGLIVHDHISANDQYFNPLLLGALEVLEAERFGGMVMSSSAFNPSVPDVRLPMVIEHGEVDGAIVYGSFSIMVEQLRNCHQFADRPIVSLISPLPGCSQVVTDDYSGGYLLMKHLLDLGHRNIGHFFDLAGTPHQLRGNGARQACLDAGLNPNECLNSLDYFKFSKDVDTELAKVKNENKLTAIVARQDHMATIIYQGLLRADMRVPEDISLVGYDDSIPIIDAAGSNLLTTIHVPLVEVGRQAAALLLRHLHDNTLPIETVSLPVELINRKSTCAPRQV
jgi:LacI family transcriptional regulator